MVICGGDALHRLNVVRKTRKTTWVSPRTRTRTTQRDTHVLTTQCGALGLSPASACAKYRAAMAPGRTHARKRSTTSQLLQLWANYAIVSVLQDCLEKRVMGKLALSCHFAPDVLSRVQGSWRRCLSARAKSVDRSVHLLAPNCTAVWDDSGVRRCLPVTFSCCGLLCRHQFWSRHWCPEDMPRCRSGRNAKHVALASREHSQSSAALLPISSALLPPHHQMKTGCFRCYQEGHLSVS